MFVPLWLIVALAVLLIVVALGSRFWTRGQLWMLQQHHESWASQIEREKRQLAKDYAERERSRLEYEEIIRKQRAAESK